MKIITVHLFALLLAISVASAYHRPRRNAFHCGVPRIAKNEVIVRGQDASPGSWPWHGAIYHRSARSEEKYACGGTLVSLTFVLTAGHCVKGDSGNVLPHKRVFVRLGVHDLKAANGWHSQDRDAMKIHQYEDVELSRSSLTNDIALVELSSAVQLNDYVQPACINQVEDLSGKYGVVAGWGVTEDDRTSATLKIARMPVIRYLECLKSNRDLFGATLDDSLFCAGYTNGTTICNGDSGGGLLFKRDDKWYVGGVVSFTALRDYSLNLCSTKGYAAFTNVFFFIPWIRNIMGLTYLEVKGGTPYKDAVAANPSRKYANHLPRQCGTMIVNRIVSGQKARLFELPWMAILIYRGDVRFNAGTLISKRYVMTAANTVTNITPYKVRLGEYILDQEQDCDINDVDECAPPVQDYSIEYIIRHQNYSKAIKTRPNDIALIRLKHEVTLDDHIQPICLPVTAALRQMRLPEYVISGWGHQDTLRGQKSQTLAKAKVPLVEQAECQRWFMELLLSNFHLTETHICAGRNNTADACTEDGGGPLGFAVQNRGIQFVQFGIISFGIGCGEGPAIYTNVSYHMDWILANMAP